jgi:fatty acid desaturase
VPAVRRAILAHGSSLVINPGYVRHVPMRAGGRVQEAACAALVWTVLTLWIGGVLPAAAPAGWLVVLASASLVNGVRTLAAHRYAHDASEREFTTLEQLLDTCTLGGQHPLQMLGAPVGLRYHALHHWIPSLPYHNLPRAHRLLAASLPPDEPYHQTTVRSISGAIVDLIAQVRKASSAPRV